jgi:hypothetical protein
MDSVVDELLAMNRKHLIQFVATVVVLPLLYALSFAPMNAYHFRRSNEQGPSKEATRTLVAIYTPFLWLRDNWEALDTLYRPYQSMCNSYIMYDESDAGAGP